MGRVGHVLPVDLDTDGDWDLVVGEPGWRESTIQSYYEGSV